MTSCRELPAVPAMAAAIAAVLALLAGPLPAHAQAATADWKFYGAGNTGVASLCFYDARGAASSADGHVRVLTKCLREKDIDALDVERALGGKIMKKAAQKAADYYVPPIAAVTDVDFDQTLSIVLDEEIANSGEVQPQSTVLYELDCHGLMLRELSMSSDAPREAGAQDQAGTWKSITPDGNGATLAKLLCRG